MRTWGLWGDGWEAWRVPRLHWNKWTWFGSALGPLGGNPSRRSLRGKGKRVAPGPWNLSHPRSRVDPGCGARIPEERGVTAPSAGATAEARGDGTRAAPGGRGDTRPDSACVTQAPYPAQSKDCGSAEQGIFYSQTKAQTMELMRERQQTQSRSEIPGGR